MIPKSIKRPSHKELTHKIRAVRDAVARSAVVLLNQEVLVADALELGYLVDGEIEEVMLELLDGTDPLLYVGAHPPQRSYDPVIEGIELFAFVVNSRRLGCLVYYKFALEGEAVWVVSLHRSRGETR